jgi:HPt (histidine-containing phosphotransfer) domain-containing protein
LSKPLRKDVFLDLVAKTVKRGPIATGPLETAHSAVAEVMIDPTVVEELAALAAGGEPDFLANLVGQFAQETESRLVELREAVETGDGAAAGRIAHLIQGSGSQLGGRRLALSCGRLEVVATTGSPSAALTELRGVELDYQDLCRTLTDQLAPAHDKQSPCLHA